MTPQAKKVHEARAKAVTLSDRVEALEEALEGLKSEKADDLAELTSGIPARVVVAREAQCEIAAAEAELAKLRVEEAKAWEALWDARKA